MTIRERHGIQNARKLVKSSSLSDNFSPIQVIDGDGEIIVSIINAENTALDAEQARAFARMILGSADRVEAALNDMLAPLAEQDKP